MYSRTRLPAMTRMNTLDTLGPQQLNSRSARYVVQLIIDNVAGGQRFESPLRKNSSGAFLLVRMQLATQ